MKCVNPELTPVVSDVLDIWEKKGNTLETVHCFMSDRFFNVVNIDLCTMWQVNHMGTFSVGAIRGLTLLLGRIS